MVEDESAQILEDLHFPRQHIFCHPAGRYERALPRRDYLIGTGTAHARMIDGWGIYS